MFALRMVSAVVNVLLTITKSVSSMLIPAVALLKSIGSTFAKKRRLKPFDASLLIESKRNAS